MRLGNRTSFRKKNKASIAGLFVSELAKEVMVSFRQREGDAWSIRRYGHGPSSSLGERLAHRWWAVGTTACFYLAYARVLLLGTNAH